MTAHRSRRIQWWTVDIAVLVATILVATLLVTPAAAFDQYSEGCGNDTSKTPEFQGPEWELAWTPPGGPQGWKLKDPFWWGWMQWTVEVKKWNGAQALTGGGAFGMDYVSAWQLNGAGAVTLCSLNEIRFNIDNVAVHRNSSQQTLQGFSAHEWGHAFGLGHSGRFDSHDGQLPTMATCIPNGGDRINLAQDDEAAAAYLTESMSGYHAVTANNSFEDGAQYWGRVNTALQIGGGGVDGSPNRGIIWDSSSTSYIFSTTRVTDLGHIGGNGNVNSDSFRARVNHRDSYPWNSGSIRVVMSWRKVDYASGFDSGCNFYGDNKNVSTAGSWQSVEITCWPSSGWTYCDTPTRYTPSWVAGDEWDAADVRISIYNRTKYPSGTPASVSVDRARVRWNY